MSDDAIEERLAALEQELHRVARLVDHLKKPQAAKGPDNQAPRDPVSEWLT